MRTLIVGCGYVGKALGEELARRGHEVFGLTRTVEAQKEFKRIGIVPFEADITKPVDLAKLPVDFDWVVNCVSSSRGGAQDYRSVYLGGMRNLIQWLSIRPPKKFVYTSSTSVYGQTDGSLVTEVSPTEPATETARILLEAEKVLLQAAAPSFPALLLRVAGIYGPGRGYWLKQFLTGEASIEGKGDRYLNMVHRDDVVGAIIAALEKGSVREIYNVADDEPVRQIDFFQWLSKQLNKPMPPSLEPQERAERKRASTNKKISNARLKSLLRYEFKYPTFRDGFRSLLIP
jgi:nucleoside-diphosphate-sugar epimerase